MNEDMASIPPGRIWLPVQDLNSALCALEILIEHISSFRDPVEPLDCDEV